MMDKIKFQPAVKWSGSKRSQVNDILTYIPDKIGTYYEPFCGGCSVLYGMLCSGKQVGNYVCSDLNGDLIGLWNEIKNNPKEVCDYYCKLWNEMNCNNLDVSEKRKYFETVRERYNKERNPLDFMFIMRTTTNGMPRYNSNGEFNNSFHITRNGIIPDKLNKIIYEWSELLRKNDVNFECCSYENIKPSIEDYLYLDPPYACTTGMYFGGFDNKKFFEWLRNINCGWILSYDGISGEIDSTYDVPNDIYDEHVYIKSGNSSFKRVIGKDKHAIVYESLYIKNEQSN